MSAALVMAVGGFVALVGVRPDGDRPLGLAEATWASLMRTLDPGTMGGDTGWSFRFAMLVVTLGGIFVISTLIGVITSGIEARLEELGKGRSRVIESGHTVVLGWSPAVFTIVRELVVANENQHGPCVVVLGQADKKAMEDAIRTRVPDTRNTKVICRTGSPIEQDDLDIASLDTSKSIVVVTGDSAGGDAEVIKTLLAVTRRPERRQEPYHIIAAIRDPRNLSAAKLAGGDEVQIVLVSEFVARIIAQTCRQPGLATVYSELLDFRGDEIYFAREPRLEHRTFAEALHAYEDCSVVGIRSSDGVQLNPRHDTILSAADEIIAIAQDDDRVRLSSRTKLSMSEELIVADAPDRRKPERTLVLGWNWRAPSIIRELDLYVAPGSEVVVVCAVQPSESDRQRCCAHLRNQKVTIEAGDTSDREVLEKLSVATYSHIVLLAYSDDLDPQQSDARTLMTLLHLRDLADEAEHQPTIVTEVMDIRNQQLAEVARADDFVVSDQLVSQAMTQLSENKALGAVFADLFDPQGCEVYLKPARDYVRLGEPMSFGTALESASRRGQVAIGYRLVGHVATTALGHGVVINPAKSKTVTFGTGDQLIVLAEE